jgi:hypothetical protein
VITHFADLAVESLRENDAEPAATLLPYEAGLGHLAVYRNTCTHLAHKFGSNEPVYYNYILLLMIIAGSKYFIDDISIVREENEPVRIFVEPANGENTLRVAYKVNNI